jgi:hypothetical protein
LPALQWRHAAVTTYRCYFLTADLHIATAKTIEAHNDAEAIELAKRALAAQHQYRAFELWQSDQRVGSEFPDEVQPPASGTRTGRDQ